MLVTLMHFYSSPDFSVMLHISYLLISAQFIGFVLGLLLEYFSSMQSMKGCFEGNVQRVFSFSSLLTALLFTQSAHRTPFKTVNL